MENTDNKKVKHDCMEYGHYWEDAEIPSYCNSCSFKAGPGDWGMCMPDAGGDCIRPTVSVKQCRYCGAIQNEDGLVVSPDFFDNL